MSVVIDRTGQRYNRLVVLGRSEPKYRSTMWECRCDCGNIAYVDTHSLISGHTKSCGCWKREKASERLLTHGEMPVRLYRIWRGMKARCNNPHTKDFHYYGARGIKVCDEWMEHYESFRDWAFANGYSDTLTLDRVEVNKDYSPDNCRWVDRHTQMRNTRNNLNLTFNGETKTVTEWAEITGMERHTISYRKNVLKWDDEKVLTTFPKHNLKEKREEVIEKIRKLIELKEGVKKC